MFAFAVSPVSSAEPMKKLPANAAVEFNRARNTVARIEGGNLLEALPEHAGRARTDPAATSIAFVSAFRDVFRLSNAADELKTKAVQKDDLGFQHVRLQQVFRGLEVVHCGMIFHFNKEGALYLITGDYIATPTLQNVQPQLDSAAAVRAAASALGVERRDWPAELKIWASPDGRGMLAYEVAAAVAADQAWRVFVHADSGKILDRISTIYTTSGPQKQPARPKQP